jgi:hypothetical protein
LLLLASFLPATGQTPAAPTATLTGAVTDPSGASVPGTLVIATGEDGANHSTKVDTAGRYTIGSLPYGVYKVRFSAKGFAPFTTDAVTIRGPVTVNAQLVIATETQEVDVQDSSTQVDTQPDTNGTALVLGQKELSTLSDDPDELQQQLQAMAGPAAGPSGGQIYIDGFTGGNMPSKTSILQVKINSNPYAPEFDRPGFGRIEIITKPGTSDFHGQIFYQFNDRVLDSRSPLLQQSTMPPYRQNFFGVTVSGPIKKQKASFTFDADHRIITENAFVYATTLDTSLLPQVLSEGVVTPQTRTSITPRLDYSINGNNTLTVRYQATRIEMDNQGVGNYNLPSTAYNLHTAEDTVQLSETAILGVHAVNESRFQYMSSRLGDISAESTPAINVSGAFQDGGSSTGNSGSTTNSFEFTNLTTFTHGTHSIKWGARVRDSFLRDTSLNGFNGTFVFLGGTGPELDASNMPIAGTSEQLTALEVYQRTLLFQQMGFTPAQIFAGGGGASQFMLNAGIPTTSLSQFDIGLFANDDWRVRPNLTLSYGLRYEAQANIGDYGDWAPRAAIAWGIDGGANKAAKTVLRAGFGVFYDRIAIGDTLAQLRYNGVTQESYFLRDPEFFPQIPSLSSLTATPQELQFLAKGVVAPRNYQASLGVDRQINRYFRLSAQWVSSRGVHLERQRNVNSPIDGVYPYGDSTVRLQTETDGFSRTNMLVVSPNLSYKKLFLFGFYMSSWGKDDNEGLPANSYDLRAEWGPSSFADIRQRVVVGTSLPLPWKISVSPFFTAQTGSPYNITTGIDSNDTGFATERPALVAGMSGSTCSGTNLVYAPGLGCFNLLPAPGTPTIGRNYGRGPGMVALNLRLARTWGFGNRGESGIAGGFGGPPGGGGGGMRGGGGPPPGAGMGGPGGPPRGLFGGDSGKRYNLTLSIQARNILNHPSYGAPEGDLSSPFFGESRSLAGFGGFGPGGGSSTTYDRKIDVQLRFTF